MRSEEDLRSCCDRAKEAGDYGAYLQAKSELVDFYRETFRFEEAFSAAEDVLMLMEELNLEETESFAAALMQAAVTYREAGREQEALTVFTRALKICGAIWKPEDERFVGLDREIGLLLERLGEEERAEIFLQKALTLLENRPDATGKAAQVKTDLALLALRRKRPERAQTLLEEAIAGFRASGNQGDVRYSASLAGLGEALFSQGRLEKRWKPTNRRCRRSKNISEKMRATPFCAKTARRSAGGWEKRIARNAMKKRPFFCCEKRIETYVRIC